MRARMLFSIRSATRVVFLIGWPVGFGMMYLRGCRMEGEPDTHRPTRKHSVAPAHDKLKGKVPLVHSATAHLGAMR